LCGIDDQRHRNEDTVRAIRRLRHAAMGVKPSTVAARHGLPRPHAAPLPPPADECRQTPTGWGKVGMGGAAARQQTSSDERLGEMERATLFPTGASLPTLVRRRPPIQLRLPAPPRLRRPSVRTHVRRSSSVGGSSLRSLRLRILPPRRGEGELLMAPLCAHMMPSRLRGMR
jgi:hypothetical protein